MSIYDVMKAFEKDSDVRPDERVENCSSYQINDTIILKDAKFYDDDGMALNTADFRWKITNKETSLGQTRYECENKNGDIVIAENIDIKGKIISEPVKEQEPEL